MEASLMSDGESQQPVFDSRLSELTAELLEDWLFVLGQSNRGDMTSTKTSPSSVISGHFKSGDFFELIVHICREMNQPREVRYTAAEIFDAFMVKHLVALRTHVMDIADRDGERRAEWRKVVRRVCGQLVLRMYSCVQIASKLNLHRGAVPIATIERCLNGTDKPFGPRSILKSELRVLDTLGFRLDVRHPLLHVEALLAVLDRNDDGVTAEAIADMYRVTLSLLDAFYLRRDDIFRLLFRRITGKASMEETESADMKVVATDSMFVACVLIACSCHVLYPGKFQRVVEQLGDVTHVPVEEIYDLSLVVITMCLHEGDNGDGGAVCS